MQMRICFNAIIKIKKRAGARDFRSLKINPLAIQQAK